MSLLPERLPAWRTAGVRFADAGPQMRVELHPRKNRIPTEEMIDDLWRISRAHDGRPVTRALYASQGKFGVSTVACRFGSWNGALAAAKLPITNLWRISDGELFENLAGIWRQLGRQPSASDLVRRNGVSKFSMTPYEGRFGSWNNALQAFSDFINGAERPRTSPVPQGQRSGTGARGHPPSKINWRLRATVLIGDNCLCRMCGASPAKDPAVTLHVDHIVPWSKGGETREDNLQSLCSVCNIGKGNLS